MRRLCPKVDLMTSGRQWTELDDELPMTPLRTGVIVAAAAATVIVAMVLSVATLTHPQIGDAAPQQVQDSSVMRMSFLAGCGNSAVVAPLTVPIWCSSSDQALSNLTWSSWGGSTATANGDLLDRTCSCAGGAYDKYPVRAVLAKPAHVAGTWRYSELTLHFPGDRPAWAFRPAFSFQWSAEGFISQQDTK